MLTVFIATVVAATQETYRLEIQDRKGDAYVHTSKENMEAKMTMEVGEEKREFDLVEREFKKVKVKVLAAPNGRATKVEHEYTEAYEEKKGLETPELTKEASPLQGRRIVMVRQGDKTEYEGAENIDESVLRKIRLKDDPINDALPKEAVAVGKEWEVPSDKLLAYMNDDQEDEEGMQFAKVTAKARFEKVETKSGEKCALVVYTVNAEGEAPGGIGVVMKLTAKQWISLDRQRQIALAGEGTITFKGETEMDAPIVISGSGTLKAEETWTYEK